MAGFLEGITAETTPDNAERFVRSPLPSQVDALDNDNVTAIAGAEVETVPELVSRVTTVTIEEIGLRRGPAERGSPTAFGDDDAV